MLNGTQFQIAAAECLQQFEVE